MSAVFLAQDCKHDRSVAIKVLHPDLAASLGPERFLQEIELAARLSYPHILPLFDSGSVDGLQYYVMLYVERESLRERLDREQKLSIEEAVHHGRTIASALDYANRQGIIHRDIKGYEKIPLLSRANLRGDYHTYSACRKAPSSKSSAPFPFSSKM